MKRLVLILLLAASMVSAGWFRTYGGTEWDEGRCVQEVDDGYIVTGFTHPDTLTSSALWLLKLDTLGNVIWSKVYGGTSSLGDRGYYVSQTTDGGYIVSGRKHIDTYHIWLLKTDGNGDTLWTRTFGPRIGYCVQQTSDGGYILTGQRNRFPSSLFLLRTDNQGDSLWMKEYLLNGWVFSEGYFLQNTEDGGYVVVGAIGDTTYENFRGAFWMLQMNSSGDIQWSYIQGGENWGDADYGCCVRNASEESFAALANFGLLKLNNSGDTLWTRDYRNGSSLDLTYDDGYVLTGELGSLSAISQTQPNPGPLWLLKTSEQGDSLWKQTYLDALSYHIEETSDKGFIVTGRDFGNGGDLFLLKTDSLGLLGIADKPVTERDNGWNVANTIGNHIVMSYEDMPQGFHAKVYDITGRQIDEVHASGSWGTTFWGFEQPAGVYYIKALDNTNHEKSVKVVITD